MFTKRTMKGVRRNIYDIERPNIIFKTSIPRIVKIALDMRERSEKRERDLFLVIRLIQIGIRIRMTRNIEKVEIFSMFVQLFQRFKNISMLYFLYFI